MPAHNLTLEEHAQLVEGFRKAPGNASAAARHAGVGRDTAARYWRKGAAGCPDIRAKPIETIIAEEQELARARLLELEKETVRLAQELEAKRRMEVSAAAQKDATDARVAEGQIVRMARGAATALLANLTTIAKGSAKIGQKVGRQLETMANNPADLKHGELVDMVRIVGTLTTALRQANDAAKQAMEMERLLLGEPSAFVQHNHHLVDVSVDEAERRLQAGLRAMERAKSLGLVVDGKILPHHAALSAGAPASQQTITLEKGTDAQPMEPAPAKA